MDLAAANGYGYVVVDDGNASLPDAIKVVDVRNPEAPAVVGEKVGHYNGVHVDGGMLYATGDSYSGNWSFVRNFTLADPADPSDPGGTTMLRTLEGSGASACDVHVDGGYVYVTNCSNAKLYVLDAACLTLRDSAFACGYSGCYLRGGVVASGIFVYVATDSEGLFIFDVTNTEGSSAGPISFPCCSGSICCATPTCRTVTACASTGTFSAT